MKRVTAAMVAALMLFAALIGCSGRADAATPPGMRDLPDPLYGVTLDDVSGSSSRRISSEMTAIKALPRKATTRVVFDEGTGPSDYTTQITQMQPDATGMTSY